MPDINYEGRMEYKDGFITLTVESWPVDGSREQSRKEVVTCPYKIIMDLTAELMKKLLEAHDAEIKRLKEEEEKEDAL